MDNFKSNVFLLIKSAITNEKGYVLNGFSIEETFKLAKKHNIVPLIFYGAINCGIDQSNPFMQKMFNITCGNVVVSNRQISEIKKIFKCFDEEKIKYMPLKGTLLKDIYPKPEMRAMGDADVLIKLDQYNDIVPILEKMGLYKKYESNHEIIWKNQNLLLELHKKLIPSYTKDYYSYFKDGWSLAKICDGTRYSMTCEDEMIYLFIHFAKHYRDQGVGIKHIVDFWIYRNLHKNLDEEYIKTELNKLQVYDFYLNVMYTIEVWFNGAESNEKVELITDVIFNSGVFGTDEALLISKALQGRNKEGSLVIAKIKKYISYMFPPYKVIIKRYKFARKSILLYPVAIVYRWFVAIFNRKELFKKTVNNTEFATNEKIDKYKESLNFVGLDFNFKE